MPRFHTAALSLLALSSAIWSQGIGGPSSDELLPGQAQLLLGPVPGVTTTWHAAPDATQVPSGTALTFRVLHGAGTLVSWTGAEVVVTTGSASTAACTPPAGSRTCVRAELTAPDGTTGAFECWLEPVDARRPEVVGVEASVQEPVLGPQPTNAQTMAAYFGGSIAALVPTGPDAWRTSVRRDVTFEAEVVPAGMAPLVEWRIDDAAHLGPAVTKKYKLPGVHHLEVGPPGPTGAGRRLELETYRTEITSHTTREDRAAIGQRVTFTARTTPPGYEREVVWVASTKWGTALPATGTGATFTTVFEDVHAPAGTVGKIAWYGARGSDAKFGVDEHTGGKGPDCGVTILNCRDVCVDEEHTLTAVGTPPGGSYWWTVSQPGAQITPTFGSGPSFQFTGTQASAGLDDVVVTVTYTPPGAAPCQDVCKLTVIEADLVVHRAPVIDPAATELAESEEEIPGTQTFVNVDNDDGDGNFDLGSLDTNVPGEDELVKVRLRVRPKALKPAAKGDGFFAATAGAGNVAFWTAATKGSGYAADTPIPIETFEEAGDWVEHELWVEGVVAHDVQQGTTLRFRYEGEDVTCEDDASMTVVGVEELEWFGDGNGYTPGGITHDSDVLDAAPVEPGSSLLSYRVFPGARAPDFATAKNGVEVTVRLSVAPVEGLDIYLRSFDVDDPASEWDWIDPNDNPLGPDSGSYPGGAGLTWTEDEDNRGDVLGLKEGLLAGALLVFAPGEIENKKTFVVSQHPGDNYRLVANGDLGFLDRLHNLDWRDEYDLVDESVLFGGGSGVILQPENYASHVLTVWRLLHVERDSMAALTPGTNEANGGIEKLVPGAEPFRAFAYPSPTNLELNGESNPPMLLDDGSPDLDEGADGRFVLGDLEFHGTGSVFNIEGNAKAYFDLLEFDVDILSIPGTVTKSPASTSVDVKAWDFAGQNTTFTLDGSPLTPGAFDDGTITIGFQTWDVLSNTASTVVTKTKAEVDFVAVDDDDTADETQDHLPDVDFCDTSLMGPAYAPAYILPVLDGGGGAAETIDLMPAANLPSGPPMFQFWKRGSAGHETDVFWVVYVMSAYQYTEWKDRDPEPDAEDGVLGVATGADIAFDNSGTIEVGGHGAAIFLEAVRDLDGPDTTGDVERATVAHEVGHQFGLSHIDLAANLMHPTVSSAPSGDDFVLQHMHINVLRSRIQSPGEMPKP